MKPDWDWFMSSVRQAVSTAPVPSVTIEGTLTSDPFRVLVATLISLRTRDDVTATASKRLFELADDPAGIVALGFEKVAQAIYPANYQPTKARRIGEVSRILLDKHEGRTPDSMDELLALPGVGRKTANLVLTEGFDVDAICVDTHVHRIPNRVGLSSTRDPVATEMTLRKELPVHYWKKINRILVPFGQITCMPVSPKCSSCILSERCRKDFDGPSR